MLGSGKRTKKDFSHNGEQRSSPDLKRSQSEGGNYLKEGKHQGKRTSKNFTAKGERKRIFPGDQLKSSGKAIHHRD